MHGSFAATDGDVQIGGMIGFDFIGECVLQHKACFIRVCSK